MVSVPEQSALSLILIAVGLTSALATVALSLCKVPRLSMMAGIVALVIGTAGILLAQTDQHRHDSTVQDYMATTYGLTVTQTEARSLADGSTVVVKGAEGKAERLRLISPYKPNPILVKVTQAGASGDTIRPKAD